MKYTAMTTPTMSRTPNAVPITIPAIALPGIVITEEDVAGDRVMLTLARW